MMKRTNTALQHAAAIGMVALGFISTRPLEAAASLDVPLRTVRYADLDLSQEADVKALYDRIQGAARRVCPNLEEKGLAQHMRARDCIRVSVRDAVERVDAPLLTALHNGHTKMRVAIVARR